MGAYFYDRGLVWTVRGNAAPKTADVDEHVSRLRALRCVQIEMGSGTRVHPGLVRVLQTRIFAERPTVHLRVFLAETIDLAFLAELPELRSLAIEATTRFKNVQALAALPQLRDVALALPATVDADILAHLTRGLRSLALRPDDRASRHVIDLAPLAEMKRLGALFLEGYGRDLETILPLLRRLQRLGLRSVKGLTGLAPVAALGELRQLSLFGGPFSDLAPLTALTQLRFLQLWNLQKLRSIAPIADMTTLEVLLLEALNEVRAFPDTKRLARLRAVRLTSMKRMRDFASLGRAPALEEFVLANAEQQRPDDLAPVLRSKTLKRAGFGFFKKVDEAKMRALATAHARALDAEIFRYPQLRGRYGVGEVDG